jgi:uncharacterized protein (DUF305 family)
MLKSLIAAAVVSIVAAPAFAQDDPLSILPPGCRDAIATADTGHMGHGTEASDMATMTGGDEVQMASAKAMASMNAAMAATHVIADPDLAFNCGMIAHHTGAIDMAKIALQHGKDEWTKNMAQMVVDAQTKEIVDMTDWVAKHTAK